ncbi:MAG: Stp1/IreP family PP2C-type Ser/Thr phosphatase [Clostridia bacterium]
MRIWGKTDAGRERVDNQDNFFCESIMEDIVVFCLCDGMGGTNGGHIASKFASVEFIRDIKKLIRPDISDDDAKIILSKAVLGANNIVYDMSSTDTNLAEMGTTLVGGFLIKDTVYIANVGDSRCYHISNNAILQVTKDHSLVQHLIDTGEISDEERETHPQKNYITRAIGIANEILSDMYRFRFAQGEYILLCSDGLYNLVSDEEIKDVVASDRSLDEKCDILVQTANENGGTDNITAVILEF